MAKQVIHILGTAQEENTGTVQIVKALALDLDPEHYRIHALFLAGMGPLVGKLKEAGIPTSAIEWQRGLLEPTGAMNFWRALRQQRFDIVHIHFGGRSVIHLARIATDAKIVRHLHGRILEPKGLEPVSFKFKGVDAVVAVSQAVADRVENRDTEVICAGVSVPSTVPPRTRTDSRLIIGTAGRLVKLKGIDFLLEATAQLRLEFPSLQVEIAGSGPELKGLQKRVLDLGLEKHVRFLGWVDDLSAAFSTWDVFVMPSFEEGFPTAALNAMAAGLPVVATTVGGIPELIEDRVSGILVQPRDLDSLVVALQELLRQREVRLSIGRAGFACVRDHFNTARMTTQLTRLYDKLLYGERTGGTPG
jgi:glycosyltransferase involved in cell wall biosynthesis